MSPVQFQFSGEVWYWRGPSPFHFVSVPEAQSLEIKRVAQMLTYGWGVIPAHIHVGKTEWTTSLIPRNGLYLIPFKTAVRANENIQLGDVVEVTLSLEQR